ncbi:MAG: hypothetical protein H6555_01940 [Lewinellaceae bacterium]|nr:hypothetical protein [Lewinellaceae bacterium]
MKKHWLVSTIFSLFWLTTTAQSPPNETHQIGDTRVAVRYAYGTQKPLFVDLFTGKRSYQLRKAGGLGGTEVQGDMNLPQRNDPLYGKLTYSGSLVKKSNVSDKPIGLRADAIVLVPNEGLVGYTLTHTAKDSVQGDTQYGFIRWRLDLATGQISEVLTDEVVVVAPRSFVLAETFLYVRKGPMKGQSGSPSHAHGYLFEKGQLSQKWTNLAVMSVPRGTASGFDYQEVKRYVRYDGPYMQIATQRDGATCEVLVFDRKLKNPRTYFPALVVYQNHARMPDWNFKPGRDLIKYYRQGTMYAPDQLFQRMVLVPSPDIAGLYGILQPDGRVAYPESSLGLAPVLTTEQVANAPKDSTYLLVHFFVVAYSGEGDQMGFAVAGPDGKLSYGSAEKPVWTEWLIYESDILKENIRHAVIHPVVFVAKLPDGRWQGHAAARYGYNWINENLSYYYPSTMGQPNEDQSLAIFNAETQLLQHDSAIGKRNEAIAAANEVASRRRQEEQAAKRKAEHEAWLRSRPVPSANRAPLSIGSKWQGFTYTAQTTARYNQVAQPSYAQRMREFNAYLNAKIYRTW